MSALLGGGKLIFKMNAGGARFDHGLHQFEGVEIAAEPGFGIGDEWRKPVHIIVTFGVVDLIGALEGLVDAAHEIRHAVGGIETLVGIHLAGIVGVGSDLPAAYIDGFQSSLDLLNGLVAGNGTKSGDEGLI